jgi:hypothetical protein
MEYAYQILAYLLAIPLEILTIWALLRGEYRHYPFLLVYLAVDFLTSVVEILTRVLPLKESREAKLTFIWIYWIDERIIQFVLFLLVLSLVHRSSAHLKSRRTLLLMLVCFSVLFAGISLFAHYDPHVTTGKWMTRWTRDMNFAAAILDFALWTLLISRPKRDLRVLMVSGALGIQFTAGAIGQALRDIFHGPAILQLHYAVLIMLGNVACLYIWWQAFRTAPARAKEKGRSAARAPISPVEPI